VFYFGGADAVIGEYQGIADGIRLCFSPDVGMFVDDFKYTGVMFYLVETPGVPGVWKTFTAGELVGTQAAEYLPPQVSMLLSFTAPNVRPNRKRTYLAGLGEGAQADGVWLSTALDHGEAVGEALLAIATTSSMALTFGTVWVTDPVEGTHVYHELETITVSSVPATQRRRRLGVGI
jgi:hypothetical protein